MAKPFRILRERMRRRAECPRCHDEGWINDPWAKIGEAGKLRRIPCPRCTEEPEVLAPPNPNLPFYGKKGD
jgi:hypothetical protein